jgi:hypothetical protein
VIGVKVQSRGRSSHVRNAHWVWEAVENARAYFRNSPRGGQSTGVCRVALYRVDLPKMPWPSGCYARVPWNYSTWGAFLVELPPSSSSTSHRIISLAHGLSLYKIHHPAPTICIADGPRIRSNSNRHCVPIDPHPSPNGMSCQNPCPLLLLNLVLVWSEGGYSMSLERWAVSAQRSPLMSIDEVCIF